MSSTLCIAHISLHNTHSIVSFIIFVKRLYLESAKSSKSTPNQHRKMNYDKIICGQTHDVILYVYFIQ